MKWNNVKFDFKGKFRRKTPIEICDMDLPFPEKIIKLTDGKRKLDGQNLLAIGRIIHNVAMLKQFDFHKFELLQLYYSRVCIPDSPGSIARRMIMMALWKGISEEVILHEIKEYIISQKIENQ